MKNRILLITKDDTWSHQAASESIRLFGKEIVWIKENFEASLNFQLANSPPKTTLISFLCPRIIPSGVLNLVELALNFHPGPSNYPGIGCYNFAIYEKATTYGAICHHMHAKVDSGPIVTERLFPISADISVEKLKHKTMEKLLEIFTETLHILREERLLPSSNIKWSRRPFTRKQLNMLTRITPDMSPTEITQRIKATVYPSQPGPVINIAGHDFYYPIPDREPIA